MPSFARRVPAAFLAAAIALGLFATPAAAAGATITVNSLADTDSNNGRCTLREAVDSARTNTKSGSLAGECAAGTTAVDLIRFSVAGTITLGSSLPFLDSSVTVDGGGTVTIERGEFVAFNSNQGQVTIRRMTITSASSGGPAAIVLFGSATGRISDVVIDGSGDGTGAGLEADTVVERVVIRDHKLGLRLETGDFTIRDTLFEGNGGLEGTALSATNAGSILIERSTFSGNTSGNGAGAIYAEDAALTVVNSTFVGNTGKLAGAIQLYSNAGAILNATVVGNTSTDAGGAIAIVGTVTVSNTLVAGNDGGDLVGTPADGSVGNQVGGIPDFTIEDLVSTTLADNGGFTPTLRPGLGGALLSFGDPATCQADPVGGVDQRGVVRPVDTCTIGAVELESVDPVVTVPPTATVRAGQRLDGSRIRARVAWTATDTGGSGPATYLVERSTDGGAWTQVAAAAETPYLDTLLTPGRSYAFRVKATDHDGNVTDAYTTGPTLRPRLVQQTSSAITYRGTWTRVSLAAFSGGSARYARDRGASASVTLTGRSFAFVTTKGPARGKARIYVNGTLVATVDLKASSNTYRVQAWTRSYSSVVTKTIRVVVLGTDGRPRVDADAFAVIR